MATINMIDEQLKEYIVSKGKCLKFELDLQDAVIEKI